MSKQDGGSAFPVVVITIDALSDPPSCSHCYFDDEKKQCLITGEKTTVDGIPYHCPLRKSNYLFCFSDKNRRE